MNFTKKYLTTKEINTIVRDMVSKETYLQAIISRDMLILYFCTDLEIKNENDVIDATFETYDKYKTTGIIKKVLNEINEDDLLLINECYYHEISMSSVVKGFLDDLDKKIDKYAKGVNFQKILTNLKEMTKIDKK